MCSRSSLAAATICEIACRCATCATALFIRGWVRCHGGWTDGRARRICAALLVQARNGRGKRRYWSQDEDERRKGFRFAGMLSTLFEVGEASPESATVSRDCGENHCWHTMSSPTDGMGVNGWHDEVCCCCGRQRHGTHIQTDRLGVRHDVSADGGEEVMHHSVDRERPQQTLMLRFLVWYFLPPRHAASEWPWHMSFWIRLASLWLWGFRVSIVPILIYYGFIVSAKW